MNSELDACVSDTLAERCYVERVDNLIAVSCIVTNNCTLHLPRRRSFNLEDTIIANIHPPAELLHWRIEQRANTRLTQIVQ